MGLREDNWIDLGERKWGSIPSAPVLAAELESRMKLYSNLNNATLGGLIFMRRPGKAPKAEGPARFFSLDDLYSVG